MAPGQALPWQVALGQGSRTFFQAAPQVPGLVRLWALDTDAAAFVDPVAVTYDAGAATLTAGLPHLSAWNYDFNCNDQNAGGDCQTTVNGGCA